FDTVGAVAEIDRVQVGGQDPVLRPTLLELPGDRRLLQLPADRALVVHVGVLDELLRDRRAALDDLLVAEVLPDGATDRAHVDPSVLVEALVLDGHDRLLHPAGDLRRGNDDPALRTAQHREHTGARLAGVDVAIDLLLRARARVEVADSTGDSAHQPEGERDEAEHEQDQDKAEEPELADPAPRLRRHGLSGGTRHEKQEIVTVELPRPWASLS